MVEIVRRAMGREDQVGRVPERRVFRQRLGIEHVQHRAGQLARAQRLGERLVVHHAGAADIDQAGAGLHRGDGARIDEMRGCRRERCGHQHEIGLGQPLVELLQGQDGIGMAMGMRIAANAQHAHAELLGRFRRRTAHLAEPHDQHCLAGDARREDLLPFGAMLVGDHFRQPIAERQQRQGGELAGLLGMHAAVVGQRHLFGQPVERQQRLDAGADDMDPAQLRRRVGQLRLRESRIDDEVVAGHQPFRGGEPGEVAQILADRPATPRPTLARRAAARTSSGVMWKTLGLLARVSKCRWVIAAPSGRPRRHAAG